MHLVNMTMSYLEINFPVVDSKINIDNYHKKQVGKS